MKSLLGVITLTQEHRFQLVDDQGNKWLFTLDHGASAQGRDLERLAQRQSPVKVVYTKANSLNEYIAHELFEQDANEAVAADAADSK